MRTASVRVRAKWLLAEWPPAGEVPADEKGLRTRSQSGGKGRMGICGGGDRPDLAGEPRG